ncbi:MAG: acylneuraminate cytidylyltransferase family protein [Dysgonamonadaceae bacterium]
MSDILAVIPARGGSKGLPNKNILPLAGHPLIAYSIEAALQSKTITRTIVSTDSEKIAEVARNYGAEVPFIRPAEFAQDMSTDFEVFAHVIQWLKDNENYVPEILVQLRPTSPVRNVSIIDECVLKLQQSDADSLRIVTPSPITPYKMWRVLEDGNSMQPLLPSEGVEEPYNQPRQKLPKTYWQIGFLDVIKINTILNGSMSGKKMIPYVVPNEYAVDIDDLDSFVKAAKVIESSNEYVHFSSK